MPNVPYGHQFDSMTQKIVTIQHFYFASKIEQILTELPPNFHLSCYLPPQQPQQSPHSMTTHIHSPKDPKIDPTIAQSSASFKSNTQILAPVADIYRARRDRSKMCEKKNWQRITPKNQAVKAQYRKNESQ